MLQYSEFLKNKVIIAEEFGFEPKPLNPFLKPHQKDICHWALKGGRRAIFASFGLGKSIIQLELAVNCIKKSNKPFLIVCPLAVIGEFRRDNNKLNTGYEIEYITDTDNIHEYELKIYLTNYERVRKGDIDPLKFSGVSFDEASILRNLKTETTNYILGYFKQIPYRYVATASPSPNAFIELLNYADYLGVASRGHLLTRFFKRNSTKAGDLTLLETKKKEFWQWVSTWAVFINKPSDLDYDDTGYDLPDINLVEHCVEHISNEPITNKKGELVIFKDTTKSLIDVSREKRDSIDIRVKKTMEILKQNDNFLIWHHLEDERKDLEFQLKGLNYRSVFGSQTTALKEKNLIDFSNGKYNYLISKPQIAGSGCNFQGYCNNAVFVGIDYKFNDFIQSLYRIYRFGQTKQVNIHIIYTQNEHHVLQTLKEKWERHKELQNEMIAIVREYGLNTDLIKSQMERQLFEGGDKVQIGNVTAYNNDSVLIWGDKNEVPDNSQHMQLTSIPFGDHYEYSDFYNDMGHNHGNENFFKQLDYLIPHMWRTLKPGRISAIHVKDRIRYSYQNGTSFTTIDDFSGKTVERFTKEHIKKQIDNIKDDLKGEFEDPSIKAYLESKLKRLEKEYNDRFYLLGKITVTTDVVAENNQTYRLGYSEKCKDGTKMGCGLPEYILIFRKAPTESNNAYADEPVTKTKENYPVWLWQLDAHAYWRSSGNKHLPVEDILKMDLKHVIKAYKQFQQEGLYDFEDHKELSNKLDEKGKLSRKYMTLPPISNNVMVWDDINRTNTLNAKQTNKKKEKHICPLQLDIIRRLIELFTMPGETIGEPFGGLFSTAHEAMDMGRKCVISELNKQYYKDGLFYIKAKYEKMSMPTLFDALEMKG